jgi:hypothetical protein
MQILKQNLLTNILVTIEIVLALFLLTTTVNGFLHYFDIYNRFQIPEFENAIYFSGNLQLKRDNYDEKYLTDFYKYLSENKNVFGISKINSFSMKTKDDYYTALTADELTAKIMGFDYDSFFDSELLENNIYPCVVIKNSGNSKTFAIGDELDAELYLHNWEMFFSNVEDVEKAKIKVVDVKNGKNNLIFLHDITGYGEIKYENFCQNASGDSIYFYIPKVNDFAKYDEVPFVITVNSEASKQQRQDILAEAKKYGFSSSKKELDTATINAINKSITQNMPSTLIIWFLLILGLISIAVLNIKKILKQFSLYFLLGCSFLKATKIYAFYVLAIAFFSTVIYLLTTNFLIFYPLDAKIEAVSFYFESLSYTGCFSILIVLALLIIFCFIPFLVFLRKNKLEKFKEQ